MAGPSKKIIFTGKVTQIIDHTPLFRELEIDVVKSTAETIDFRFRAGQFMMLHVPQSLIQPPKPALRAYSIASDDRVKNKFTLIFKKVPNGIASILVWQMQVNEEFEFTGPFGRLFFIEPPTEQIIMLNTGSGIAQHICYLKSKIELYPQTQFRLLFGLTTEEDLYYENELKKLKLKFDQFSYDYVLSQPSDKWQGKKGYVQTYLSDFNYKSIPTTFYLCGNPNMIKETKQFLIETEKIDAGKIFSEAFS